MKMSDFEILRDYREAKDKNEQVKILADMNLCTQKEVVEFLMKHGINAKCRKCRNEAKLEKLKTLHSQGMTDEEMAEELGFGHEYVGQLRRRLGLSKNKKRKPAKADFLKSSV